MENRPRNDDNIRTAKASRAQQRPSLERSQKELIMHILGSASNAENAEEEEIEEFHKPEGIGLQMQLIQSLLCLGLISLH